MQLRSSSYTQWPATTNRPVDNKQINDKHLFITDYYFGLYRCEWRCNLVLLNTPYSRWMKVGLVGPVRNESQ